MDNARHFSVYFSPWNDAPYKDAAEKTALGGLSLDAFLSEVFMFFSLLKMGISYFIQSH